MSEVGGKVPETTKPRIAGALDMVAPGVELKARYMVLLIIFYDPKNHTPSIILSKPQRLSVKDIPGRAW